MSYCTVSGEESTAKSVAQIFYRTYGNGPVKILLIIGLAGTHDSWGPQIRGLAGTEIPNDEKSVVDDASVGNGIVEVCAFDNRGVGRSYAPTKKSEYTTTIMAKDAIALMDHLDWKKAHVFGHSMGGMIACKLAALVPDRVLSLALLNVTGGGFQCLPKVWSMVTLAQQIVLLMLDGGVCVSEHRLRTKFWI
ncbi:putative aminoacrylate hydrolase RutD [Bienertia sinuspersici]